MNRDGKSLHLLLFGRKNRLDVDPNGNIRLLTFEHVSDRTDINEVALKRIAA